MTMKTLVRNSLHELANQIFVLATGLQNAAPPGAAGKSIHYLLETAANLESIYREIDHLEVLNSSESGLTRDRHADWKL